MTAAQKAAAKVAADATKLAVVAEEAAAMIVAYAKEAAAIATKTIADSAKVARSLTACAEIVPLPTEAIMKRMIEQL